MTTMLHLVRRDPACNLARFYRLELTPTLFGETVLVRRWGRIGTQGQQSEVIVPDLVSGETALIRWTRRKLARGYQIDDL